MNARANRVANALIARGVAAGRVGQRDAAQLRGVPAGLVRDPEGRRGDELDQHRLQGRLPVLDDQPRRGQEAGHLRRVPRPARPGQGRAAAARARDRDADRRPGGPGPLARRGSRSRRCIDGARRRARRGRVLVDRRRPDHVHLGHHRPLQGRHQAERRRLLLGPRPARGGLGDGRQVGRVAGRGHLLQLPAALPLQRPGALAPTRRWSPARRVAYVERFSSSTLLAAGRSTPRRRSSTRSARSATSSGTSRPRTSTAPTRSTRSSPRPAPKDIYNEFQERFGVKFIEGYGLTETGMATYMDPTRPARARARWARPTRATR